MSESTYAEFVTYYKQLPEAKGTCRIYERNDLYSFYGDDALLINQQVLKASRLKIAQTGGETLKYVNVSKSNLICALKYLLFVRQYKIEIFKNIGTAKKPQWTVSYKASPGNFTAIEDLIFAENAPYVQETRGLMAIKIASETANILVVGIAFCDPVLREIQISEFTDNCELRNLQSVLVQLSPQECLIPSVSYGPKETKQVLEDILKSHAIFYTECKPVDYFNAVAVVQDLNRLLHFQEGGNFRRSYKDEADLKHALSAVAAVIKYLELSSDENNFGQYSLSVFKSELYAKVDIQSVNGLSLFPANSKFAEEKDYLLGHLNKCGTHLGHRLLAQWIKQPLMDLRKLEERLDIVEIFVNDFSIRDEASRIISKFPDIETICRRIQRRTANLRDLYKIYKMLTQLPNLNKVLSTYDGEHTDVLRSNFTSDLEERIDDFMNYISMIEATLDFERLKDKKEFCVKPEYDEKLLELRKDIDNLHADFLRATDDVLKKLEANVKLECCKSIGYYFRVTRREEKCIRHDKNYMIIDTKANGVRFRNYCLKEINDDYMKFRKSYEEKQKEIVAEIIDVAVSYIQPLKLLSHTIASLDVFLSFASVSVNASKPYVRPKLREKGDTAIILKQARHPVYEVGPGNFIPNDVDIRKEKHTFYFVTGPNMGGKSTYIKSVALNVLLAQIGCFVPCDYAEISITDAFLTRSGVRDCPSKHLSTFMYEMTEMHNIMKTATPSSLLIIDEMGRGTSTFDGFGLSWAISSYIAEHMKTPCLFATHFHELTELSELIPSISNLHVEAVSSEDDIIYLYQVKPGASYNSHGIHVAKLAKFPDCIIKEAKEKLGVLEKMYMPVDEILTKFGNLPGGEIIVKTVQEKLHVLDGSSVTQSSANQSAEKRVKFAVNSQLESLARALEELVQEKNL